MKLFGKGRTLQSKRYGIQFAVLAALLGQAVGAVTPAVATEAKSGQNCGKQKIRRDGVVLPTHGVDLYIYPDAPKIDAYYSGCQNIWLEDGFHLIQAKYKNGQIQSFEGWEPESERKILCTYSNGRLKVAKPKDADCPAVDYFPINKEGRAK